MQSYEYTQDNHDIIENALIKLQSTAQMVRRNIYDIGTSFDIETTQINNDVYHHAYMYIWQFAINDVVFYGRTWGGFLKFYLLLVKVFKLGQPIVTNAKFKPRYKMICLVHNLSFEFSFIARRLPWAMKKTKTGNAPQIFTKDAHNVVTATTRHGLEFRCTLNLTSKSLSKLAKDYNLNSQKLIGALDYERPRNSLTPLTQNELNYAFYDVLILTEYFNKFYSPTYLHSKGKLPTTKTSIIRNELREHFNDLYKRGLAEYPQGFPTSEESYKYLMNWVYRGGYTHANAGYTSIELNEDIESYDFTSSYPARMIFEKFPYEFKPYTGNIYDALNDHKNTATIFTARFHNLRAKTAHSLESLHKCMNQNNPQFHKNVCVDNGRIASAERLTVAISETDYLNYVDVYEWGKMEIVGTVFTSEKKQLPQYLLDLACKYYYIKSTIDSLLLPTEYKLSKENVNGLYGMCCSSIFHDNYVWNGQTFGLEPSTRTYEEMTAKQILLPQWGVYISAYARRAEIDRMTHLGHDAIYGDTDSWKVRNPDKHRADMDLYNDFIDNKLNSANLTHLDFNYIGCKDSNDLKNKIRGLGRFTRESKIVKFKTLGCKRYIMLEYPINKNGEISKESEIIAKCAGMKSAKFLEKMEREQQPTDEIFRQFDYDLLLDSNESGKLATCYNSAQHTDVVVDDFGNTETMGELSSACLFPIPFKMKGFQDYIYFFTMLQEKLRRKY